MTEGVSSWSKSIARLAKMRRVEEKVEMVERQQVKIARKKSHLVNGGNQEKICLQNANSPVRQFHCKRRALSVGEDGVGYN